MSDPRDGDRGGQRRKEPPSLLRNMEGFFRNLANELEEEKGPVVPAEEPTDAQSREVGRKVQEVRRGEYLYRRTIIDEVIFDPSQPSQDQRSQ